MTALKTVRKFEKIGNSGIEVDPKKKAILIKI